MQTKKYKKSEESDSIAAEQQATYAPDVNALKLAGIDALMRINNPSTLEKAVKDLFKTAQLPWQKKEIAEEEETIGKDEILAGIREGLLAMKERYRTGQKGKTAEELLNEL